eukprot:TRINITY_DN7042_c0_g1_i2.p1 TRINITY_DN7042_c0_g1~~TRINITY_DN7042_c0_g1_i2.p1  ORF type:complete len:163 (+),score=19.31 TRINITY_DN7042_c0_g1_i2:275-763(+)
MRGPGISEHSLAILRVCLPASSVVTSAVSVPSDQEKFDRFVELTIRRTFWATLATAPFLLITKWKTGFPRGSIMNFGLAFGLGSAATEYKHQFPHTNPWFTPSLSSFYPYRASEPTRTPPSTTPLGIPASSVPSPHAPVSTLPIVPTPPYEKEQTPVRSDSY